MKHTDTPHTSSLLTFFVRVAQLLLAFTFIVSGLSKCIDPAGTAIKFTEYLQYFGFAQFTELTMGMAWLLSLLETACGVCLLMGYARARALSFATLMMVVFTPLTLWLAVSNAIDECGCFGDAIHLSNWQTFGKNVVICFLLALVWKKHDRLYRLFGKTACAISFYWCMVLSCVLCWFGTWREPLIDFRPYHPGTDLLAATVGEEKTEDAPSQAVSYTCIYRLGDTQREFSLDSLPDEAEGWEFVETIEHAAPVASAGDQPSAAKPNEPVHIDFFVKDIDGRVCTREVLSQKGYTLLLLSPSLDHASQHDIDRIEQLWEYASDNGYPFYCVTARDEQQYKNWRYNTGAEYDFLFTDASIVQTICRSNPGVMLLRDGVICWKKPLSILDTKGLTSAKLNEQTSGEIEEIDYIKRILYLLILFFAPFPLFLLFEIPKKFHKTTLKKDSKDA